MNITARWRAEDGSVDDVSESDATQVVTSLHPSVKITCQKLDDGMHYFIPEPFEANDDDDTAENEAMET